MAFDSLSMQLEQRYLGKRVNEHNTISNPPQMKTLRHEMKVSGTSCSDFHFGCDNAVLRVPWPSQFT